jgi:hypothetical protein
MGMRKREPEEHAPEHARDGTCTRRMGRCAHLDLAISIRDNDRGTLAVDHHVARQPVHGVERRVAAA